MVMIVAVAAIIVAGLSIAPALGQTTLDQSATDVLGFEFSGPETDGDAIPYVYDGFDAVNPGWIVALFDGAFDICAGSLNNDTVVVTAEHCVEFSGDF